MKKVYSFLIIALFTLPCYGQAWEWAFQTKGFNNIKSGIADDNSIYLTGNFHDSCFVNGTMFHGAGVPYSTTLLIKLGSSGNIIWSKSFSSISYPVKIQMHHNDVYIAGNFVGILSGAITDTAPSNYLSLFLAGYSPSGNVIFYKREGGPNSLWLADMFISNDHILITGNYFDSVEISGQPLQSIKHNSIYVAKYDFNGVLSLLKTLEGSYNPYIYNKVYKLRCDQAGNIYLLACLIDTVNITSDTTLFLDSNNEKTQILTLEQTGKFRNIEIISQYFSYPMNFAAHGNFDYTLNLFSSGCNHCNDATIINKNKIENNDSNFWTYSYGGSQYYNIGEPQMSMSPGDLSTTDNFVYFTGHYAGSMLMGDDSLKNHGMFLAKLDHDGNYQFVKSYEYSISPQNLSNAANGSLIVTGTYGGVPYFGSSFLDTAVSGYGSCFVAKFKDSLMTGIPITKKENNYVSIYPNPSRGIFTIKSDEKHLSIRVLNIQDQLILTRQASSPSIQLDLSSQPKGIYFIEIDTGKEKLNKKIVLQ